MAQVINTNILSLTTQNNLNRSQGVLGSAIERLSSGSRINSAKDDAAGQAIANRFTSNVKGLTQAARNANDGISIAQTTEGALNEINDNLQRIRELTVQAKNGTNSNSDITSIQNEVDERLKEIDRISKETQFNGVKVLSGEKTDMSIQVGTNDNEVINFKLDKIDTKVLEVEKEKLFDAKVAGTATSKGDAIDATVADAAIAGATGFGAGITAVTKYQEDGADVANKFVVTKDDGTEVVATLKVGTGADANKAVIDAEEGEFKATDGKAGLEVKADALKTLDDAINKVDESRSKLGAIQNRFQSTINNLNNSVNNLSAARSRIQDADFATEVSNMSRGQILQQAGTAVLAQANQVPQGVLSLLR